MNEGIRGGYVGLHLFKIHALDEILDNAVVEPSAFFVMGLSDAKVIAPSESVEGTRAFVIRHQT